MNSKMTFDELVDYITKELEYNKTISIAENPQDESMWWSMTKIDVADSKSLYCNYYGGGAPHVIALDADGDIKADAEYFRSDLKDFLVDTLNLDLNEPLVIDLHIPLLERGNEIYQQKFGEAIYDMYKDYDSEIVEKYFPTFEKFKDIDPKFDKIAGDIQHLSEKLSNDEGLGKVELIELFEKYCSDKGIKWDNSYYEQDINDGMKRGVITSDWEYSLISKETHEISRAIGYGFSQADIAELASIHKDNECLRGAIEDLLEDCNFHTECSDFSEGNYDNYIEADDKQQEPSLE